MRVVLVVSRIIIITIHNQNVKSLSLKKIPFWLKSFKSIVCQICNKFILGLFFERENIEEKLFLLKNLIFKVICSTFGQVLLVRFFTFQTQNTKFRVR